MNAKKGLQVLLGLGVVFGLLITAVSPAFAQAGPAGNKPPTTPGTGLVTGTVTPLSQAESDALLYVREEEKLAHDVYVFLYNKWNLPVFQNIANSEQTHTDAIKTLITRYGLQDPALAAVGKFTDPDLQKLYEDLTKQGSISIAEALKVGGAVEEIDILDLQQHLTEITHADLRQVFQNLLNGSYNHLSAFTTNYASQAGQAYAPQYMTAEQYQTALSSAFAGGPQSTRGRRGGFGGGR